MNIRPATIEDLKAMDSVPKVTTRAMAVEQDGEVIAIWGIYPRNTRYVLYSTLGPKFRESKRNWVHGIKAVKQLLASVPNMPVLASADPDIDGSDRLLLHMGFKHLTERTFQWQR